MKNMLPLFFAALVGLAGCNNKCCDNPPAPTAPDDVISLQVTGSNLTGLTARLDVVVGAADDGQLLTVVPAYTVAEDYTGTLSKTIAVATVPHYRSGVKRYDFTATPTFNTATTGTGGTLTVRWLVNGKPTTATSRPPTVTISGTAPALGHAYLSTNSL